MTKPILLDLFCGAGGAAMGYHRAGFQVVGVDNKPQPNYPFDFVLADALEFVEAYGASFDAIHASPPCQVYSCLSHLAGNHHIDLVPNTRELLLQLGRPYVIENVPGAPLIDPLMLCGTMFGLKTNCGAQLRRHRLFEIYPPIMILAPECNHNGQTIMIVGDKARNPANEKRYYQQPKEERGPTPDNILFTLEDARAAMGIYWMSFKELSQAIPPAYTEHLGRQLILYCNQVIRT